MSVRADGRNKLKRWRYHKVHVADPVISSLASLALLCRSYLALDKTIYTEHRMSAVRKKWLKNQMKTPDEKGGLTCSICGRQGLKPNSNVRRDLATIDHIIELQDGGDWKDPINFRVACWPCNSGRNNIRQKQLVCA